MKNRIDVNNSILNGYVKYEREGHGSSGQIKTGSWLGRNIKIMLAGQEIVVNKGSLIDYINSINPSKPLSKNLECFGGATDKEISSALSEIEDNLLVTSAKTLTEEAKNNKADISLGSSVADTCENKGKSQEAFELFKALESQSGDFGLRTRAESLASKIYPSNSEELSSALKEIAENDEKALAALIKKAEAGEVNVGTIIRAAGQRDGLPSEGVLQLYLYLLALPDMEDFSIIDKAEAIAQKVYSSKPELLASAEKQIAEYREKALGRLLKKVNNLPLEGDLEKAGLECEKRGKKDLAFQMFSKLAIKTAKSQWRDKAIGLVKDITNDSSHQLFLVLQLTKETEAKFVELCQIAEQVPSVDNLTKVISLCVERQYAFEKMAENAKDPAKANHYAEVAAGCKFAANRYNTLLETENQRWARGFSGYH